MQQENAALLGNRFEIPFSVTDRSRLLLNREDIDILRMKSMIDEAVEWKRVIVEKETENVLEKRLFKVLATGYYRYGPIHFIEESWDKNKEKIGKAETQWVPIFLTLSFFPAKAPNPLKTFWNSSAAIDIGELASVLRFYEIASLMSKFHEPGVRFLIVFDWLKYHQVFGIPAEEARQYSENIKKLIKYLGIEDYFQFIEETEMYPSYHETKKAENIEDTRRRYDAKDSEIFPLIEKLRQSAAFSVNVRWIPLDQLFAVYDTSLERPSDSTIEDLRRSISMRALDAAIQYQGTYRTPYDLGVFDRITEWLQALRCTVHPKEWQIGLYGVHEAVRVFPHHGQWFLKAWSQVVPKDIRVCFAADILRKCPNHTLIWTILDPDKYPFASNDHPFLIHQ